MEKTNYAQLKGKKILFATVPGDGHFNPLTGLAKHLQETAGCDVRWYTSPIFKEKLAKLGIPHFTYVHTTDINGNNLEEMMPDRHLHTDPAAKLNYDLIHLFAERGPEHYLDLQEIHREFPFDLMVADSLFPGIPFVSKKMDIPVVTIGIIPLAEVSNDLAPYGAALHPPKDAEEKAKFAEMRAAVSNVVFKESIDFFAAILEEYNIPHKKSIPFDLLIKQSDLYLQIGTSSFEYPRTDIGENVRFVGSLLPYSTARNAKSWFDPRVKEYSNVILVTQGTVERDTTKIIQPTLEAFQGSDTLVVATTGGNGTAALREKFSAPNLIIEDYIPFEDVMPYVDVYVTNGGYSGTLLGIRHKLPMVAAGVHEGKNEVCARIGYFELGIDLRTETPDPLSIYSAVQEITRNRKYRENVRRLAEEMKSLNANELSAQYISQLITAKKGSPILSVNQVLNWLSIF
jgi:MGT family glycosyltransferase